VAFGTAVSFTARLSRTLFLKQAQFVHRPACFLMHGKPRGHLPRGTMRKVAALFAILLLLAASYFLSPLWVAMDLRRAALTGDTATLEARVDWPAVRQSLKESLVAIDHAKAAENAGRGLPRPSLWQRIKAAASPTRYADQIIDRYVSADGVVRAVAARSQLKALLGPRGGETAAADDFATPDLAQPFVDRAQRFWSRLKRVAITSAISIEIEIADRRVPARSYLGTVAFTDMRWRVVDVRVLGAGF
jgi:hypothetical protein